MRISPKTKTLSADLIGLATTSTILVAIFIFMLFSPATLTSATSSPLSLYVTLSPVISLSNSSPNLTTTLDEKNKVYSLSTNLSVSTNNYTGYTLSMTDPAGTDLEDADVETTIPSIESATTLTTANLDATFPANRWAFTTDLLINSDQGTTTYKPLPAETATELKVTDEPANASTTTVTFSTKINNDIPAGAYSDKVYFTAIANTLPDLRTIFDLTYMQDMTASACENTPTPYAFVDNDSANGILGTLATTPEEVTLDAETGFATVVPSTTLIDKRDNQEYTVRKLADGNCWMTYNRNRGQAPYGFKPIFA